MSFATSSFAGVQVTKAAAAPKASGRTARLVVEARRTKASAPAKSAAKVRHGKKSSRAGIKSEDSKRSRSPNAAF